MVFKPYEYQTKMIDRIKSQDHVGLFLDMGLGKTVITLTAIKALLEDFVVLKVLVIAPKRVAEDTWSREHKKWDHLKGIRLSKVLGTRAQREKALRADADIYVVGRDNVKWLVETVGKHWFFDMVVIDELSSFKNPQAQRFRALRRVIPHSDRVVGLTGTPSPNGYLDLWPQIYLLDRGDRLGKTLGSYRSAYFTPGASNGYVVYNYVPRPGALAAIRKRISDICVSMSAADYLTLPERIDREIKIRLPEQVKAKYRELEEYQLAKIDGRDVAAINAAAVMNKLLQMANGCVYDDENEPVFIHDEKIKALSEIADTSESPILVFYSYRHDLAAIKKAIPDARELSTASDIADWNAGQIKVLLAHPASVGYGLNLQDGGNVIVWYGLTWSLELYQQANARLHRQGQQKPVIVHHLIAEDTADEQVMQALRKKDTSQSALLDALKERRAQA